MAALTYPGVYISEVPSAVHSIAGVATSIAAFVGWAAQGPTTQAVLVESFMDFQRQYGGLDSRSLLGYAVSHFFANGGQQAYIVRVVQGKVGAPAGTAAPASLTMPAAPGSLVWTAKTAGTAANALAIQITPANPATPTTFNAAIIFSPGGLPPVTLETFTGLTAGATIPLTSMYVTLKVNGTPTAAPAVGTSFFSGGTDAGFATPASATLFASGSTAAGFTIMAQNPGAWANLLSITASPQAGDSTNTRFSLSVSILGANGNLTVVESYNNLSVLSTDPSYALTVINADSNYIALTALGTPAVAPAAITSPGLFFTGGADGAVLDPALDGGSGGTFMSALNADGTGTGGVHLLDRVDAFNILCVPGESQAATVANLQKYCSDHRAFYIVDPPQSATAAALTTSGPAGSGSGSLTGQYANSSAYYFPWVQAPDPLAGGRTRLFPPCGFIAGIYASTDADRGVWKAPAGIDASLTGVSGLQYTLTDTENGNLNTQGINCLREFKVYGDVVWGARTLQGSDAAGSQWKYIPIRRLALFIESSLFEGTQWVVFEPNDQSLWGQIRMNIGAFMQNLFLQGAFQGSTPQQAFFVKCDADNNPQSTIDLGIVNILVGFAPLYPAEFVVIQIQQMAGQLAS